MLLHDLICWMATHTVMGYQRHEELALYNHPKEERPAFVENNEAQL